MPILSSDVKFFKSVTGVGLGGPISSTEIVSDILNNVFDNVNSAEAIAGDTEYRCVFIKNTHASLQLLAATIFIEINSTSPDTDFEIGLDPAGINQAADVIPNESTPPVGVIFSSAPVYASGLLMGDLPASGGYHAVWIKRVVSIGAAAIAEDAVTLAVQGETTA